MSHFSIIGQRFSPSQFQSYVTGIALGIFLPNKIVLHNTAIPTIAQRPVGFNSDHMFGLEHYYEGLGWQGGPHLFVDQNGIWVFNPLDRRGTHSPSWNATSWGVEMLGDYAIEAFDSGPGLMVQNNSEAALAVLFRKIGVTTLTNDNFKFHKEDPLTTHNCPGAHVVKSEVMARVQAIMSAPVSPVGVASKVVIYRAGFGHDPAAVLASQFIGGSVYADAEQLRQATGLTHDGTGQVRVRDFVGDAYSIAWDGATHKAYLVEQPTHV
ncbi:hypothetical protein BH11ARM1_BH11ARM1_02020 [soil metagenome]